MRANSGVGVPTVKRSAVPNAADGTVCSSAGTPSWAKIASAVAGSIGVSHTATARMLSHRLYSTSSSLPRALSSFASTHGAVSSIYLLQRLHSVITLSAASALW